MYVGDRLPGKGIGLTQFQRTQKYPVHAAWLWDHYRNCFLDVYIAGYLRCDNYIGRDEEQAKYVWHLHCLGSDSECPREFLADIRA